MRSAPQRPCARKNLLGNQTARDDLVVAYSFDSLGKTNDRSSKSATASLSTPTAMWSSCIVGMAALSTGVWGERDRWIPLMPLTPATKAKAAAEEMSKSFMRDLHPVQIDQNSTMA